jgi:cellulose synthase/poly-beta-1,6-N-acetylglucosamine synthase-like glycosyltransferase
MKVTGFSFIKNAVKYQYPIVEAIQSILPLCDEVIVAVGNSEDNTRNLVERIDPKKIKIIDTVWDESLKEGGKVLAEETNKALKAVGTDSDWCFYIQGDEVLHEQYHHEVYEQMKRWKDAKEVDGLLFKYRHFYGSFDYVGVASNWYKHEIRVIRNNKKIYSYREQSKAKRKTYRCIHSSLWLGA